MPIQPRGIAGVTNYQSYYNISGNTGYANSFQKVYIHDTPNYPDFANLSLDVIFFDGAGTNQVAGLPIFVYLFNPSASFIVNQNQRDFYTGAATDIISTNFLAAPTGYFGAGGTLTKIMIPIFNNTIPGPYKLTGGVYPGIGIGMGNYVPPATCNVQIYINGLVDDRLIV
jgi:hypothetical protein